MRKFKPLYPEYELILQKHLPSLFLPLESPRRAQAIQDFEDALRQLLAIATDRAMETCYLLNSINNDPLVENSEFYENYIEDVARDLIRVAEKMIYLAVDPVECPLRKQRQILIDRLKQFGLVR